MPTPIGPWRGLVALWRRLRWWGFSRAALIRRVRELQAENRAAVATIQNADARAARLEERLRAAQDAGTYFQQQLALAQRRVGDLTVADLERVVRDALRDREAS